MIDQTTIGLVEKDSLYSQTQVSPFHLGDKVNIGYALMMWCYQKRNNKYASCLTSFHSCTLYLTKSYSNLALEIISADVFDDRVPPEKPLRAGLLSSNQNIKPSLTLILEVTSPLLRFPSVVSAPFEPLSWTPPPPP